MDEEWVHKSAPSTSWAVSCNHTGTGYCWCHTREYGLYSEAPMDEEENKAFISIFNAGGKKN